MQPRSQIDGAIVWGAPYVRFVAVEFTAEAWINHNENSETGSIQRASNIMILNGEVDSGRQPPADGHQWSTAWVAARRPSARWQHEELLGDVRRTRRGLGAREFFIHASVPAGDCLRREVCAPVIVSLRFHLSPECFVTQQLLQRVREFWRRSRNRQPAFAFRDPFAQDWDVAGDDRHPITPRLGHHESPRLG